MDQGQGTLLCVRMGNTELPECGSEAIGSSYPAGSRKRRKQSKEYIKVYKRNKIDLHTFWVDDRGFSDHSGRRQKPVSITRIQSCFQDKTSFVFSTKPFLNQFGGNPSHLLLRERLLLHVPLQEYSRISLVQLEWARWHEKRHGVLTNQSLSEI